MPYVECQICSSKFYAKPFHQRKGWGKYCSKECQYKGQTTSVHVMCNVCAKPTLRQPAKLMHSKSSHYFCSKSCQAKWRNKIYVGPMNHSWKDGEHAYRRIMRDAHIPAICTHCGIDDKAVLLIHHIDRNRKNNVIENLMWLCRNCHYKVHLGKTI